MARKGRINFGGLLKDEKLEKHDQIDHRHTYSEGRNSFREITLSDSEDEVIDSKLEEPPKSKSKNQQDITSTPQQLLRLSFRHASSKLTGEEVDLEVYTKVAKDTIEMEHEMEMYHEDVKHLSDILDDYKARNARIRALLQGTRTRRTRTTSLPSSPTTVKKSPR